jgi:hypothetical protein
MSGEIERGLEKGEFLPVSSENHGGNELPGRPCSMDRSKGPFGWVTAEEISNAFTPAINEISNMIQEQGNLLRHDIVMTKIESVKYDLLHRCEKNRVTKMAHEAIETKTEPSPVPHITEPKKSPYNEIYGLGKSRP